MLGSDPNTNTNTNVQEHEQEQLQLDDEIYHATNNYILEFQNQFLKHQIDHEKAQEIHDVLKHSVGIGVNVDSGVESNSNVKVIVPITTNPMTIPTPIQNNNKNSSSNSPSSNMYNSDDECSVCSCLDIDDFPQDTRVSLLHSSINTMDIDIDMDGDGDRVVVDTVTNIDDDILSQLQELERLIKSNIDRNSSSSSSSSQCIYQKYNHIIHQLLNPHTKTSGNSNNSSNSNNNSSIGTGASMPTAATLNLQDILTLINRNIIHVETITNNNNNNNSNKPSTNHSNTNHTSNINTNSNSNVNTSAYLQLLNGIPRDIVRNYINTTEHMYISSGSDINDITNTNYTTSTINNSIAYTPNTNAPTSANPISSPDNHILTLISIPTVNRTYNTTNNTNTANSTSNTNTECYKLNITKKYYKKNSNSTSNTHTSTYTNNTPPNTTTINPNNNPNTTPNRCPVDDLEFVYEETEEWIEFKTPHNHTNTNTTNTNTTGNNIINATGNNHNIHHRYYYNTKTK